jgi:hypothetical protein
MIYKYIEKYNKSRDQDDALEVYLTLSGCRDCMTKDATQKNKDPV